MLKDAINRRLRLYFGVLFNMVFLDVLKLIFAVLLLFCSENWFQKLKLPAILGWLLAGDIGPARTGPSERAHDGSRMVYYCGKHSGVRRGPHDWYGAYLAQDKKAAKQIVVTTITESLGTFLVVSLVFGVIFWDNGRAVVPGIPVRRYRF